MRRRCCDWYSGVTLRCAIARPTMQMTDAMHHLAVGCSRGRGNRAAAVPMISNFVLEDAPCSTSGRARERRALPRLAEIRSSGCSPVPGCGGAAKSIVLLGILVQTAPSRSSTAPYKDACCQGVSALAVLLPFILLSVFCLVIFQSVTHHATMPPPYSHSCWQT